MKRLFTLVLCVLLLAGCSSNSSTPAPTQPQSTLPPEYPGVPLLDMAEASGESGNLLYIPNPHVESMVCPQIRLCGNGLLLYEHTLSGTLQLKLISLEDGCLLAEASYPADPSAKLQMGSGMIGICDSSSGQVRILNELLETKAIYTVPCEGENWCLNQDMDILYLFYPETGLQCRNLATGQTWWLLDNATYVQPLGTETDYVLFSYTDLADQKTYTRCLNLATTTLETLPVTGNIHTGVRNGGQWLLRQNIASGTYILVNQLESFTLSHPEGAVQLLPGRRQLLITDPSYRELTLYNTAGKFLSRCSLPQTEYASVGMDLVWSGYWEGYFFRDTYDNAAHLMFWDTDTDQDGADLPVTPFEAVQPPQILIDQHLYQKVQELSQRFGVDIRIAEQCTLDYSHYLADVLEDPYAIRTALNVLELALSSYPEGFLQQLLFGNLSQIRVELVQNLRGKSEIDTHPESIGGFAQVADDHYLIVLDGLSLDTQTVYHELSHVIDKRLQWDADLRPQALFSEETWLSLQPEGFRYAGSYVDMPDATAAYEHSGYFISRYAMTYPTEDRATLMAHIISDKTLFQENPGMAEKMRYYAACIRDCFDTEGWPETTLWEYNAP